MAGDDLAVEGCGTVARAPGGMGLVGPVNAVGLPGAARRRATRIQS